MSRHLRTERAAHPNADDEARALWIERELAAEARLARAEARSSLPGAWAVWRRSERRRREERERSAARLITACQLVALAVAVVAALRGLERFAPDLVVPLRGLGALGGQGGALALAVIAIGLALGLLGALRLTWIES